ncbi:ribosome silencing factor [uncultured Jannaschia sp.]|uniref:ribosome silencing factor n=1 Tax=uncultured Jannaschia sp. TaxID=293347 RepID=UPI002630A19A|nr:ribosome silencing factor [uncultured Jannaschia sp.]
MARGPLTYPEDRNLSVDTIAAGAADLAPKGTQASDDLLALILTSLDDDKAEEIVQIDLRGKSSVADHMVVCSGRSTRQVTALSEKLAERIKPMIGRSPKIEGKAQGDWVLVDAGDVIVHIFRPEVREFYQLEKMWQDPSADGPRAN